MTTDYQKNILEKAQIEFENIEDTDVLTWDFSEHNNGMRAWYYLYAKDGSLKDIKTGAPIPLEERKFGRPKYQKSKEMLEFDRKRDQIVDGRINKLNKKIKKKIVISTMTTEEKPIAQKNKKRNISPEERQARADRMRAVAKAMWAKRKAQA